MYSEPISFLSRLRYGVTIYSPETGKEIDILTHLKKRGKFDAWVLIGKEKKVLVRLVAQKLTQAQADSRVRKAKNHRDKRLNHSKDYYQLLQYNLFITTEEEKTFSIDQIAQLYQLRWRIETIYIQMLEKSFSSSKNNTSKLLSDKRTRRINNVHDVDIYTSFPSHHL